MAAINSPPNNSATPTNAKLSPRHSGNHNSSPRSRHSSRKGSPPWSKVRRGESESPASVPSSALGLSSPIAEVEPVVPSPLAVEEPVGETSDNGDGENRYGGKKRAWKTPSNGVVEVGPVMGADSWPALSESARSSGKSPTESVKDSADGSAATTQGSGAASSSSQKEAGPTVNLNSNSTSNNSTSSRPRSLKNSYVSGGAHVGAGSLPQQPDPSGSVLEKPLSSPSPKDHAPRSGYASQSHSGNGYPSQRNTYRNRNGNSHSRGDGSNHSNSEFRREQDRGNQDWNSHRNFNGQPARFYPRYMRSGPPPPPPSTVPYIAAPLRPYGTHLSFPEFAFSMGYAPAPPPETLRGFPNFPVVAPIPHPAAFFPPPDLQLHTKIANQIDYYFSNENLVKDIYLREKMDAQGWVPIELIARFNKVSQLSKDVNTILGALQMSTIVEVQGYKVRRRNDWMRWLMPPSAQIPIVSTPQSPGKPGVDALVARIQSVALEENAGSSSSTRGQEDCHTEAPLGTHLQLYDGEATDLLNAEEGPDHFTSAKN